MRKGLTKSETGTYLYEKSGNIGNSGNKSRCDCIYLFPVFETCSRCNENVTAFVSASKSDKAQIKGVVPAVPAFYSVERQRNRKDMINERN